jgi:hypothetical protein
MSLTTSRRVLFVFALLFLTNCSALGQEKRSGAFTVQIVGLRCSDESPEPLLLTLDVDKKFRSISSGVVSDKDLQSILADRLRRGSEKPVPIVLHVLNEKALTFEDIGEALMRIKSCRPAEQQLIVYVHCSSLLDTKRK